MTTTAGMITYTYDVAGRMVRTQRLTQVIEWGVLFGPRRSWLCLRPLPGPARLAVPLTTTHRVISYTYDALYRLTDADYSTGEFYQYAYDAVGNRLSLTTHQGVVNYQYDAANRLTSVNGQAYTWTTTATCSQTAAAATAMTTPTDWCRS